MKRRQFLNSTLVASASTAFLGAFSGSAIAATPKHAFKLNYAPHFNMFKNLGGADPIDPLKFAADQGFSAWEDNQMKKKPIDLQKKITEGNLIQNIERCWDVCRCVFPKTSGWDYQTPRLIEPLQRHRDTPACNECHRKIDPAGFALENFNPIGQWRSAYPNSQPVDASGVF